MLFSLLAGYFNYIYILLIIVSIHELGHLLCASFCNFNIKSVTLFPFGGLTEYDEKINVSIIKELFVLIGGPLLQLIFMFFIIFLYNYEYVSNNFYNIFLLMNKYLFLFNLLPIVPLDGSKFIYLLLCILFPYKKVLKSYVVISIVTIVFAIVFYKYNILRFLIILLLKEVYIEYKNTNYKFNKFLLERANINFEIKKGSKIISNKSYIKRCVSHRIKHNNMIYEEKEYLNIVVFK